MTKRSSRNPLRHALKNRALGIQRTVNALRTDWQHLCDFAEAQHPRPLPLETIQFLRKSIHNLDQDAQGITELCDKIDDNDCKNA